MKKILVTNEQYNKIAQKEADNYWKKCFKLDPKAADYKAQRKRISQEYDAILDQYEIIPFTINTDNDQLKKAINYYCQTEEKREFKTLYRGFTNNENTIYNIKKEFNLNTIYDGGYNISLYSDDLKLIVDYTEGDLNFSISDTQELYAAEKQRTINFYNDNY